MTIQQRRPTLFGLFALTVQMKYNTENFVSFATNKTNANQIDLDDNFERKIFERQIRKFHFYLGGGADRGGPDLS